MYEVRSQLSIDKVIDLRVVEEFIVVLGSDGQLLILNCNGEELFATDTFCSVKAFAYLKSNKSLIIVYNSVGQRSCLEFAYLKLDHAKLNLHYPRDQFLISYSVSYPGYVEFLDRAELFCSYEPSSAAYTVYDLVQEQVLLQLPYECEIRLGEKYLLGLYPINDTQIKLVANSLHRYPEKLEADLTFERHKALSLIELFGDFVIYQQDSKDFEVFDICKSKNLHKLKSESPQGVFYCFTNNSYFLVTVHSKHLTVWELNSYQSIVLPVYKLHIEFSEFRVRNIDGDFLFLDIPSPHDTVNIILEFETSPKGYDSWQRALQTNLKFNGTSSKFECKSGVNIFSLLEPYSLLTSVPLFFNTISLHALTISADQDFVVAAYGDSLLHYSLKQRLQPSITHQVFPSPKLTKRKSEQSKSQTVKPQSRLSV